MSRPLSRSAAYQYKLVEIPFDHQTLSDLLESHDEYVIDETKQEIDALWDELKEIFYDELLPQLTSRQQQVISLRCKGLTQIEIGKALGILQTSVQKTIFGNSTFDYKNKTTKRFYGGAVTKLQKLAQSHERVIAILAELAALAA